MGWMGVLINFTDFTHMTLLTDVELSKGIYLQKTRALQPFIVWLLYCLTVIFVQSFVLFCFCF